MWIKLIFIVAIANAHSGSKLDFSFQGLTKEKFFRGVNNSVTELIEKAKELNLSGNYLDSFLDCSSKLHNLEVLDLSQNILQRFYFACKNQDVLYKLNVSHNRLSFLNDSALTERVSKLQILDISFNELEHISDKSFQHLTSLRFLKMNANPIGNNIDDDAFKNLISLIDLDISNISSSQFSHGLFAPLVSLKYLSLAFNPIESLPDLPTTLEFLDISGTNIITIGGIGTVNLIKLTMNDMPKIESLDMNDLRKLNNLAVLSVENNPMLKKITSSYPINDGLLPSIYSLSLKNCSVNKLSIDLKPIIDRISKLNLQYNPWNCDCDIKWIISLNSTKYYKDEMRCKSPEKLTDKRLSEISLDELDCGSSNGILLALLIGLGFLTVSVIATALFCITRGPLRHWRRRSGPGDTVTYANIITRSIETEKILDDCDITDYP